MASEARHGFIDEVSEHHRQVGEKKGKFKAGQVGGRSGSDGKREGGGFLRLPLTSY